MKKLNREGAKSAKHIYYPLSSKGSLSVNEDTYPVLETVLQFVGQMRA